MKTVVGMYMYADDANKAVQTLESAGLSESGVQVLRSAAAIWQRLGCTPGRILSGDIGIGVLLGLTLYSFFGVLVAAGEVAMGFNPATAIGALLIFVGLGVFVGGMLGAFFGLGDVEQQSRFYMEGIRHGGALLVLRTADDQVRSAMDVLRETNAEGVKICRRTSDPTAFHGLAPARSRLSQWTRRTARGVGLALLLVVLLFFTGEGLVEGDMPNLFTMSLVEELLLLALVMTLVGIVVAWRWEGIGGFLIVGSVLLFVSVNAIASGYWRFGVLDPLFLLVGLLFLWDWWRTYGANIDHPAPATG